MKRALVLCVLLASAIVAVQVLPVREWAIAITAALRGLGVAGAAALLVYALLASVFVPGSLLTMLVGATWGLWVGLLIIVPGTALATLISVWLGRTLLRDVAKKIIDPSPTRRGKLQTLAQNREVGAPKPQRPQREIGQRSQSSSIRFASLVMPSLIRGAPKLISRPSRMSATRVYVITCLRWTGCSSCADLSSTMTRLSNSRSARKPRSKRRPS